VTKLAVAIFRFATAPDLALLFLIESLSHDVCKLLGATLAGGSGVDETNAPNEICSCNQSSKR